MVGGPEVWEPKISHFFIFPPKISLFVLCSLWASSRGISMVFEVLVLSKMHVWAVWVLVCEPRRLHLVLTSSQATGVQGVEPTNRPTFLVIDMTWRICQESDLDTVSVQSLVGSTVEVPESGDEVMSDPDPEVVEAHSSAAVKLAFSTSDDVDPTRIFSLRASVMKTVPV